MMIKKKLNNNKVTPVVVEPKKRGRKPLSEKKPIIEKVEPKKRGRKPLDKTKPVNKKIVKEVKSEPKILTSVVKTLKKNKWSDLKIVDTSKFINVNFYINRYFPEETEKTQIVLHHTISGPGARGTIETFVNDPTTTAAHIIIDRNGDIYQLIDSKYWAQHLGIQGQIFYKLGFNDSAIRNRILNQHSISVELDNWGGLTKINTNKYMTAFGNIATIDDDKVLIYPNKFKDWECYESYSIEQLKSLGELLLYWNSIYNIPLTYKGYSMFDVNMKALSGEPGIWSHDSYRDDKSDCHPDPNLISLLKTIDSLKQ